MSPRSAHFFAILAQADDNLPRSLPRPKEAEESACQPAELLASQPGSAMNTDDADPPMDVEERLLFRDEAAGFAVFILQGDAVGDSDLVRVHIEDTGMNVDVPVPRKPAKEASAASSPTRKDSGVMVGRATWESACVISIIRKILPISTCRATCRGPRAFFFTDFCLQSHFGMAELRMFFYRFQSASHHHFQIM